MNNLKKLTIIILNYNRITNLSKIIYTIYPSVKKYKMRLIILDDSSDLDLKSEMNSYQRDYSKFKYIRNKKNIGHDANYIKAISLCKTQYLWIVSNSLNIDKNIFGKINKSLTNNDLIIIGSDNRKIDITNNLDKDTFLEKIAWHVCLMGSTIMSRKIFKDYKKIKFKKFNNFPHVGLIFSVISKKKIKYYVQNKISISSYEKSSYWLNNAFTVFLLDWSKTILNLENYPYNVKIKTIREHDKKLKLFSLKNLLVLKSKKFYNIKTLFKYYKNIKLYSDMNIFNGFLAAIIPSIILKHMIFFYKKIFIKKTF